MIKKYSVVVLIGETLIELMLSLTIALLLLSVMFSMYLTSEHSHRLQLALNEIQENAYTTIHLLNDEIRKAGYIGCAKLTEDFPVIASGISITHQNALVVKNHEFTVRHASFSDAILLSLSQDLTTLYVNRDFIFSAGDWIVISTCQKVEVTKIKAIYQRSNHQKIILHEPLHMRFAPKTEVSKLEINRFYVSNTKRKNADGSRISALFFENIKHQKIELAENISELNIQMSESGVGFDFEAQSSPFKKRWYSYVTFKS